MTNALKEAKELPEFWEFKHQADVRLRLGRVVYEKLEELKKTDPEIRKKTSSLAHLGETVLGLLETGDLMDMDFDQISLLGKFLGFTANDWVYIFIDNT